MSLTINLPPDLEQRVRDLVAAGEYTSADEVVDQAIRILLEELRADELAQKLQEGLDSGEPIEADAAFWAERHRRLDAFLEGRQEPK